MKIRELVEKLSEFDPEAEVQIHHGATADSHDWEADVSEVHLSRYIGDPSVIIY